MTGVRNDRKLSVLHDDDRAHWGVVPFAKMRHTGGEAGRYGDAWRIKHHLVLYLLSGGWITVV